HLRDALIAILSRLPAQARRTLTWDHGSEMAQHHEIAPYFTNDVFFAHPASPWQRGTNENTNGLLRQYLPKRTNLALHSAEDLRAIEERLNNRPRKTLGWQTPAQAFTAALTS
ncbi:IS30 family transposase, partial [Streptomyces sp. NPDC047085]|uniref:IS30 family transposase n=1 Tax=Streptomyces sp. NPDC047085 TaxID=3155140 RepID=UPI0034083855